MDVAAWLRELGLERYAPAFEANDIAPGLLAHLTAEDLRELGVASVGHRRILLGAIAALREPQTAGGSAPSMAGDRSSAAAISSEGERRTITVMFCDMVGSTALSGRLDPEDMHRLNLAYYGCVKDIVDAYDGYVAKYLGDGVLVYFGYPRAHEEDAERAARAGYEIVRAVAELRPVADHPLQARIGIATGLVVVGDLIGEGSSLERTVVGETPNLASRLQDLAMPGAVVVSEATRALLGPGLKITDLGARPVRGFADPVGMWRVDGVVATGSRFDPERNPGPGSFVGRAEECRVLLDRQRLAWGGLGQMVVVSGEPGIGKSRLSAWLTEQLAAGSYTSVALQCSPYHGDNALYPFTGQIEREAGFETDDTQAERLDKLAVLAAATPDIPDAAPLLAALLSLPTGGRHPPIDLTLVQRRRATLALLLDRLEALSRERPVLVLFEDVHWADASSLEWLEMLAERVGTLRLLAVVTHRPGFVPGWEDGPRITSLSLARLDQQQVGQIAERIAHGRSLPAAILAQVVARTDGVPLFVEELTKAVLESGLLVETAGRYELSGPLSPLAIPATLQASLMERLDHLASVRGVAQIGAVIGREFPFALIREVAGLAEAELADALRQLAEAELLFSRGEPPDAVYVFKHALVQDTAYSTLLNSRRQILHRRIAEALRDRFAERAEAEPEIVAHHFAQASLPEIAVGWWRRAGERAMARSANTEAAQSFANGLDLLVALPPSPERSRREVALRLSLGLPLLATRGYASRDVEDNYEAARAIAEAIGDRDALFASVRGLWNCAYDRGRLDPSIALAEELVSLAEEDGDAVRQALAYRALGSTRMSRAEFAEAQDAFARCIAVSRGLSHRSLIERYGEVPELIALLYDGWVLSLRGYGDSGLARALAATRLARALDHPISLAFALTMLTTILLTRRDHDEADAMTRELLAICADQALAFWAAAGGILAGAAAVEREDVAAQIDRMERGVAAWRATGAELYIPMWSAMLAQAALAMGDLGKAEATIEEGLDLCGRNGDVVLQAELLRLRARAEGQRGDAEKAGATLHEAIALAERQDAGVFRLRAACDLVRLLVDADRRSEACALLAPIAADFREHRDGPDMADATALLSGI